MEQEFKRIQDKYEAFLHYSELEKRNYKYPQVYLASPETFNPGSGVQNRLYYDAAASWAAARDAASGGGATQINLIARVNFIDPNWYISRVGECFNTASLDNDIDVTAAVIEFYINYIADADSADTDIVSFNPTNPASLVAADYNKSKHGTTPYASKSLATTLIDTYNAWTLNKAGRDAVNLTGYSNYSVRSSRDTDDAPPTGRDQIGGDNNNSGNPEKLIVTYGAGPVGVKTLNELAIASIKTVNDVAVGSIKTIQDAS